MYEVYCKIDWEQSNNLTVDLPAAGADLIVNSKGIAE
jgi:hypothetical protein